MKSAWFYILIASTLATYFLLSPSNRSRLMGVVTCFLGLVPSPLSTVLLWRSEKDPVTAGHVITQNMLGERGGRVFRLFLWQTLWVSKPQAVAKNYPLYRGSKSNLSIKNATLFVLSSKYRRLPFTKNINNIIETRNFLRLVFSILFKISRPNRSENNGSVSWIFALGGNLSSSILSWRYFPTKTYSCHMAD